MPRRMGRPGLVGTMARTAVIAGTASATMNAVNGRAQQKAAAQQQAAADQQQAAADQQQMAEMQAQMADMQAQMAAQQAPTPAVAAPAGAPAADDVTAQLTQLKALVDQGILTQEEFEAKKRQLLGI